MPQLSGILQRGAGSFAKTPFKGWPKKKAAGRCGRCTLVDERHWPRRLEMPQVRGFLHENHAISSNLPPLLHPLIRGCPLFSIKSSVLPSFLISFLAPSPQSVPFGPLLRTGNTRRQDVLRAPTTPRPKRGRRGVRSLFLANYTRGHPSQGKPAVGKFWPAQTIEITHLATSPCSPRPAESPFLGGEHRRHELMITPTILVCQVVM